MKRYRLIPASFDYRANTLTQRATERWTAEAEQALARDQERIRNRLIEEYGIAANEQKLRNFIDLGPSAWSVLAYHNKFFAQARHAFVVGGYFPALTGACSLGERILNHLILKLRKSYEHTPEYNRVSKKQSFANWDIPIDTLEAWKVLQSGAATKFRELKKLRNDAIHFRPETDVNDRELALAAIGTLSVIINEQFGGFGPHPWFIPNAPGYSFLKRSAEDDPFIRAVYLPSCAYVGPYHELERRDGRWVVIDDFQYESKEISDEAFIALLNDRGAHPPKGEKRS